MSKASTTENDDRIESMTCCLLAGSFFSVDDHRQRGTSLAVGVYRTMTLRGLPIVLVLLAVGEAAGAAFTKHLLPPRRRRNSSVVPSSVAAADVAVRSRLLRQRRLLGTTTSFRRRTRQLLLLEHRRPQQRRVPSSCLRSSNSDDNDRDDDNGAVTESSDRQQQQQQQGGGRRDAIIDAVAAGLALSSIAAAAQLYQTAVYTPSGYRRVSPTQFVAALGDPNSNSGTNAREWGVWAQDPGPRGVFLRNYRTGIVQQQRPPEDDDDYNDGTMMTAPAGWKFDPNDWWLEEHGIIMESPAFPIRPGRYLVTGGRVVTTGLTVREDGSWKLDDPKARLYDSRTCRAVRRGTDRTRRRRRAEARADLSPRNNRIFPCYPGRRCRTLRDATSKITPSCSLSGKPCRKKQHPNRRKDPPAVLRKSKK